MRLSTRVWALAVASVALWLATPAVAQITTGTVAGSVVDNSGGAIPGATVVLISRSQGTKSAPVVTNSNGEYVIPGVTADTYTVEVTMDGFRPLQRENVSVSGAARIVVPTLTLEVGAQTETVTVTAQTPMIQAQTGERSAVVETAQVQNLPIASRNFAQIVSNALPGVTGTTRLGGGGQNNIMMDGISAMDTGNNGQMLQMNLDAIQEVKVLTQGYQAEFGRSSGLQISAVTKSGSNRIHGSLYEIAQRTSWNTVPWLNQKNGTQRANADNDVMGYTVGGPVGRPGGDNKLFFFYSHEYRPSHGGGGTRRYRLPTDAEINGDFRQSTNQNGALITLKAPFQGGILPTNQNCGTAAAPMSCQNILKIWRNAVGAVPNVDQARVIAEKLNYNYETIDPTTDLLLQQPAIRLDYQMSPTLRITGKYAGQRQRVQSLPQGLPGFNDTFQKYPFIHNFSTTANYALTPTTFVEGTWGMIVNYLGAPPITEFSNRFHPALGFSNFPLLYPDAGAMDPRYYERKVLVGIDTPFFDQSANMMNLMPNFNWGNLISNPPPNISFPGFLNINRTNDVAVNLTKVWGSHTAKAGFYLNHSYKAQNTGAGGGSAQAFQGIVNFAQDNSNPIDTGFGYANALMGVFSTYQQSSQFVEGSFLYNNVEWYLQDNWRVNNRLTLDYGLRFVHQQPQYDQYQQASNWFLGTAPDGSEGWTEANAPQLYAPGCTVAISPCPTGNRSAMNPVNGALLGTGTTFAIGTLVPNTGDPANGVRQAGDGTSKYNYVWPKLAYAPRIGVAYDLTGNQGVVIRGSYGLFFDRPDGNSVFSQVGNFPFTETPELRWSRLQDVASGGGSGVRTLGVPTLVTFEYENPLQKSHQWNMGAQISLPWSSALDVSYVGQRATDRLQRFDLNSVDFGTAFLPQNQNPTLAPTVDGTNANVTALLRPYPGIGLINQNTGFSWRTFHSIQTAFNRRYLANLAFGVNYTYTISDTQNIAPRLEHYVDASGYDQLPQPRRSGLRPGPAGRRGPDQAHPPRQRRLGSPGLSAARTGSRRSWRCSATTGRCPVSGRRRAARHTTSGTSTTCRTLNRGTGSSQDRRTSAAGSSCCRTPIWAADAPTISTRSSTTA